MATTPARLRLCRYSVICALAMIGGTLVGPSCYAQGTAASPAASGNPPAQTKSAAGNPPVAAWSEELNKYPGLLPELAQLGSKLRENVTLPLPRTESHLLPLLPESTTVYAAAPNYGDTVQQSLTILREELKHSEVLRDWWTHGQVSSGGAKLEDTLDKVSQLYQYLGDETVFFSTTEPKHREKTGFLVFAEIRKPGLESKLREWLGALALTAKPFAQVLDSKQLAAAQDPPKGQQQLFILVRPDFLVLSFDLPTVRNFDAHLTAAKREFASSPFGRRVSELYAGGATLLAAADLQPLLAELPLTSKDSQQSFQRSGFADMQYLAWKHGPVAGQIVSQGELSFTAPRHGAAAWLAKPGPLGSLDFLSPQAPIAVAVNLANLAEIFDDTQLLAGPSNAGAFAAVAGGEKALNLKLKEDLLNQLPGEIAFELHKVNAAAQPVWETILKVNDADRVEKTLSTLLTAAHLPVQQTENGGVTLNTVHVASQKPMDISYAIANGYLVVASQSDVVAEAFRLHGSADSLAKSRAFIASLPPGQSSDASAVFYENPLAGSMGSLKDLPAQFGDLLKRYAQDAPPSITRVYAEPTAIREVSASTGLDLTAALVGAAVAIPNLLRSRIAANEATAIASIRTVNTAQVTYAARYPQIGFASDLASLGPHAKDATADSPQHARVLDESLANAACTGDTPCIKSGYQFRLTTPCQHAPCRQYVVVATPVDGNTGTRSFCSTHDAILHAKPGPPTTSPVTVPDCAAWPPLH
ncbi:MAG: hypothetical protein ABSG16_03095 [Candidatus Acidiferrum sp.]